MSETDATHSGPSQIAELIEAGFRQSARALIVTDPAGIVSMSEKCDCD